MSTQISERVYVKNAPDIPGLAFRGFRGQEDYPGMAAVIDGSKVEDEVERSTTVEDIANTYEHLTNCDPYQDMLFAEVEGEMISYQRVLWEQELSGTRIYFVLNFMLPAWRRKGLGAAMLRWGEERLRRIAADHPQDGPRFFAAWTADTARGTVALLEKEGYLPVRYGYEMTRDLSEPFPEAPLPAGLEIRPVEEAHLRPIWEAMSEAFRDHWGYVPPTEENYREWLGEPDFNPSIFKIAWDGDQVAGMVQNYVLADENEEYRRKRGYTEGICVRRPWRKRGLAHALIVESMKMFKEMGMTETALGVDAENTSGALRLYESLGYRQVKKSVTYRKPME
ncbi:MAG: GNAT family N-acetyltransferase [Chloroflexota bacterium]